MLKQRVMTGAGLTCGIAAVLLLSEHDWFLKAVAVVLSLMAAYELCRAGGYLQRKAFLFGTMAASIFFALFGSPKLAGIVLLLTFTGAIWLMRQMQNMKTMPEWAILLVASVSACFFGFLTEIRSQPNGFLLLTAVILIPVITDIGAYFFGKRFGKHKLAPVISPKKTWEGSVGGTFSAVVLLTLAAWMLEQSGYVLVNMRYWVNYLLIASCISQLGDLAFSAIKRIVGIKDYGTLLPGHGGILDRFDSLLAVIPFTVFVVRCFGPLL